MKFLPSMSNMRNAFWTIAILAALMRVGVTRDLITGR